MTRTEFRHKLLARYLNDDGLFPIEAMFIYRAADAYAVRLSFRTKPGTTVNWTFARALLADGLTATAGDGDVRITPDTIDHGRVWIALTSPAGHAEFAFDRAELERALDATEDIVPEGTEANWIDWPSELAGLGEAAR